MRRALIFCLVVCISVIPVLPNDTNHVFTAGKGSDDQNPSAKELKRQAALKERVELMGLGTQVQVTFRGGSLAKYEGSIDEIGTESIKLSTGDRTLTISYSQVEAVSLKEDSYKIKGQPDPVRVRQIVIDVGVGEKVNGQLVSGERFSGTIQSLEKEGFIIRVNGNPQQVKFSDVKKIEKSQIKAWQAPLLALGIIVGVVLVVTGILVAVYEGH